MINTIIIFSYVGLSQALFSAFLFYTKGGKQTHDRILIMWLLTIALRFFLIATEQIHGQFFDAEFSIGLIPLTFGPFLLLYTKYLSNPSKTFSPFEMLHFSPFLVLVSIYFMVFKDKFSIQAFALSISISTFFLVTSVIYTVFVFIWLRRFRKSIKLNVFSYDTTSNRLFWLNYISVVYVVTYIIYFITKFYAAFAGTDSKDLEIIPSIGLMILTYSVSYFSIKQPDLFKGESDFGDGNIKEVISDALNNLSQKRDANEDVEVNDDVPKLEKEKVADISVEKQRMLERIDLYMRQSKPYLNPELTLMDLSKNLNIPKHQITLLLNNYLGKNFFEYVNEYRIEETKKRLLDSEYEHLTLVAIAYGCGFNSKSTFNTFFKNATGYTPTEWRKINKDNPELFDK